jgi:hypothetical protein
MRDIIIALIVGCLLALVFSRPLGKLVDQDNGDYKRNIKKEGIK